MTGELKFEEKIVSFESKIVIFGHFYAKKLPQKAIPLCKIFCIVNDNKCMSVSCVAQGV